MAIASLGDHDRSVKILSLGYVMVVVECANSHVELGVPPTSHIDVLGGGGKRLAHAWVGAAPSAPILVSYIF